MKFKPFYILLAVLLLAGMLLSACQPAEEAVEEAVEEAEEVVEEAEEAMEEDDDFKVGLVTDVGEVDDKSFNQSAWEGVQMAADELGAEVDYIETKDAKDYGANIDLFAQEGYDVIVTVGFALGEATLEKAAEYPDVKFIGVDQFQVEAVDNVAGLIFEEDKSGYMAGALAGLLTESNTVAAVLGTDLVPPVVAFKEGYESGVAYVNSDAEVISTYHPGGMDVAFTDPEWGATTAKQAIDNGADVVFGAGGKTGNGALIEVAGYEGLYCIGVDTDQWGTVPEAHPCLVSSAMKLITPGVYDLIELAHEGSFPSGNYVGEFGLAPFHDFEDVVPQEVKDQLSEIRTMLLNDELDTGYPIEEEGEAEEEAEEEAMEEGAVVSAGSCDYGGKVLEVAAVDDLTVKFTLCKPDPAFIAKMAFNVFAIQPSEHIAETGGGGELLENPVGTGAYQLETWNRGDSIVYKRFDDYWGEPAFAETLVFRWSTESAARLLELQSGTVDYITNITEEDIAVVEADPNLQVVPLPAPNILYIAMTNTFEPFDNLDVRKAIAMGIDRERIVDNFYPTGSEVASHFTPCNISGGCEGEAWYDFDLAAAQQLLADAGYPDGFETSIYYRDVYRDYLPRPGDVAVELQTQLRDNLGIEAEVVVMESGEFIDESTNGRLDGIYLLGWTGDYPHPTNFLDFHFSKHNPQFGDPFPAIYEPLEEASQIAVPEDALGLYAEANNAIKENVPMVPVVHSSAAYAAQASLEGVNNPPFGSPIQRLIDPGDDTLVFMQNAEPISLYCADETDGESLSACQQVLEGLYRYNVEGKPEPALATECVANDDLTEWTCSLREGVKFHDGSDFDATDVVASFGAGIDASNPYHVGNTGAWEYYSYLWDGLMNAEE